MGDRNGKSIRFSVEVDDKLEKFARKLGRSKLLVFCQMVEYFSRTGKDPLDINDELLHRSLAKSHDVSMRFIKVQEKDLLIPMREEMGRVYTSQRDIVGLFNRQIVEANKRLMAAQGEQASKFAEMGELIRALREMMNDKRVMKRQVSLIFESYVEAREKITMMDGKEKKVALLQNVREQLRLL